MLLFWKRFDSKMRMRFLDLFGEIEMKEGDLSEKMKKYFQIFRIKFRSFLTKKAIKCEEPKKIGKNNRTK